MGLPSAPGLQVVARECKAADQPGVVDGNHLEGGGRVTLGDGVIPQLPEGGYHTREPVPDTVQDRREEPIVGRWRRGIEGEAVPRELGQQFRNWLSVGFGKVAAKNAGECRGQIESRHRPVQAPRPDMWTPGDANTFDPVIAGSAVFAGELHSSDARGRPAKSRALAVPEDGTPHHHLLVPFHEEIGHPIEKRSMEVVLCPQDPTGQRFAGRRVDDGEEVLCELRTEGFLLSSGFENPRRFPSHEV